MRFLFVVTLAGCQGGVFEGVAVGNPTVNASLARTDGVGLDVARTRVTATFVGCVGAELNQLSLGAVDLVQGVAFDGPAAPTCRLGFALTDALTLLGEGDGGSFEGAFSPMKVEFLPPLSTPIHGPHAYTIEVGPPQWLGAIADDLAAGEVHLDAGDPDFAGIAGLLASGTALYTDDGDGVISAAERAAGPLATGEPVELPGEDTGS